MSSTPGIHNLLDHQSESLQSSKSATTHYARSKILVITQDDCFRHLFRRSKALSTIYERPERLRFVNLGFAAAVAWNSIHNPNSTSPAQLLTPPAISNPSALNLPTHLLSSVLLQTAQVTFTKSTRKISSDDQAFAKIHDRPNQSTAVPFSSSTCDSSPLTPILSDKSMSTTDPFTAYHASTNYLDQLIGLCQRATELNHMGLSEVPDHLPQGDLYLSTGSQDAILGAIGACYTAIDSVFQADDLVEEPQGTEPSSTPQQSMPQFLSKKAFVNIRPPGHHCTNSSPMGFCWVNNVLISCMYSHLTYGIDRICILDIDLHHGNGSQEIVWKLNEKSSSIFQSTSDPTYSSKSAASDVSSVRRALKISYSSLHDINSYPCEDGDPDRIKDASVNICVGNSINQFIQNLHIEDWENEEDFYQNLYPKTWSAFKKHMLDFFKITEASPDHTLIFVSAGFDACEYETGQMSRFAKKLPASFFNRFARDIGRFSDLHCNGRLISVLEGGYSEQTLAGSSLSYTLGLMGNSENYSSSEEPPWSLSRIESLLKLCKKSDGTRSVRINSNKDPQESKEEINKKEVEWIAETKRIFEHIDAYHQVKSDISKLNRLEDKQIKLQHSMNQLGLKDEIDSSPEGLRRSTRHASASKKTGPSPFKAPSPVKPAQPRSESSLHAAKSSQLLPGFPSSLSAQPPERPSGSTKIIEAEEENKAESNPALSDQPSKAAAEEVDQSINRLFENLKLQAQNGSANQDDQGSQPKQEIPPVSHPSHHESSGVKLPKVKLVWKAGGVFGPTSESNDPPSKPHPSALPPDQNFENH